MIFVLIFAHTKYKYTKQILMARYSLRTKIKEMKLGEVLKVPVDYEGITIRNYASCIGKALNRVYSVRKVNRMFIVTRVS